MEPIKVECILTHENPDVDAMLSVLLLKRFGETQFPGVQTARVDFCPADKLTNGKTADELEREGILAVDVGGGRLDTHPVNNVIEDNKQDHCAADLVAEAVGVIEDSSWHALIEFVRQQDTTGQSIHSKDYIHHIATLPNILSGIQLKFKNDSRRILEEGMNLLNIIPIYIEYRNSANTPEIFDVQSFLKDAVDLYINTRKALLNDDQLILTSVLEWRRRLWEAPATAFSSDPHDDILSVSSLLAGLCILENADKQKIITTFNFWMDLIVEREILWAQAIEEFDQAGNVQVVRNAHVAAIVSKNGLVIKAARFRAHADIIIYRDPQSLAMSILLNRRGRLNKFSMTNLAAKVRLAECIEENTLPNYSHLSLPGMLHKWFLHQSESFLICGSPKANDFIPSKIEINVLMEIVISEIDWSRKMPVKYCPDEFCMEEICPFYPLQTQTCRNHARRTSATSTGNTLGLKLLKALESKKNE